MAQELNTVGAPTEGLGQTVTFQFNPQQTPQLQLPNQAQGVNVGIRGGDVRGSTGMTPVKIEPNPVVDSLFRMAGDVLKGYEEKAKQDRYVKGMQEAASGRSIEEVAQDRPWFSRVFGDGDAVEGARAYTQQAKAAQVAMDIEADLPNIAHLGQPEAQAYFAEKVRSNMTGDPAADAYIMQSFTRVLPTAMKAQTKLHLAHVQTQAAQAFTASMDKTGSLLANRASMVAGGFVLPEDMQREAQGLIALSIAPNGMDEEVWQATMASKLTAWGADGNLHATQAFIDAGVLDHLKPQQANAVRAAVQHGNRVQKERFSQTYSNDMIEIRLQAARPWEGSTTQDLLGKIDALNKNFQITSGSEDWIIGPNEREALASRNAMEIDAAIRKDMELRTKNASKLGEKLDQDSIIRQAILTGKTKNLVLFGGAKEKEVDQMAVTMLSSMPPEQQAKVLHLGFQSDGQVFGLVSDQKVRSVQQAINAGQGGYDARAIGSVFEDWSRLNAQDPTLASAYYKDRHADLTRYQEVLNSTRSPVQAFQAAFVDKYRGKADRATLKETAKGVLDEANSFAAWARPGVYNVNDYAADTLVQIIAPEVERRTAGTMQDQAQVAAGILKEKQASGEVELLGGHVLVNSLTNKRPFSTYLSDEAFKLKGQGVPVDEVNTAFAKAIDMKLWGKDGKAGVVKPTGLMFNPKITRASMIRTADAGLVPTLQVFVTTDDGQTASFPLTGDEVISHHTGKKMPKVELPVLGQATLIKR